MSDHKLIMDRMTKEAIQNEETREPFVPLPGSRNAVSMRRGFQSQVALEESCEEMTLAELSKKCGVHANQISTWNRAALDSVSSAFEQRGRAPDTQIARASILRQAVGSAVKVIPEIGQKEIIEKSGQKSIQ